MNILHTASRAALVVALAATLGACASSQIGGGNVVSRDATRAVSQVEYGVVIDSRQVTIEGTRSGMGAAVGAVAGGVAGSQIGGGRAENAVAGLIGDAVEEGVTKQAGIQYTVRLQSGRSIVVTQGADYIIPNGAQVQVIYDRDGSARVVPVR